MTNIAYMHVLGTKIPFLNSRVFYGYFRTASSYMYFK